MDADLTRLARTVDRECSTLEELNAYGAALRRAGREPLTDRVFCQAFTRRLGAAVQKLAATHRASVEAVRRAFEALGGEVAAQAARLNFEIVDASKRLAEGQRWVLPPRLAEAMKLLGALPTIFPDPQRTPGNDKPWERGRGKWHPKNVRRR